MQKSTPETLLDHACTLAVNISAFDCPRSELHPKLYLCSDAVNREITSISNEKDIDQKILRRNFYPLFNYLVSSLLHAQHIFLGIYNEPHEIQEAIELWQLERKKFYLALGDSKNYNPALSLIIPFFKILDNIMEVKIHLWQGEFSVAQKKQQQLMISTHIHTIAYKKLAVDNQNAKAVFDRHKSNINKLKRIVSHTSWLITQQKNFNIDGSLDSLLFQESLLYCKQYLDSKKQAMLPKCITNKKFKLKVNPKELTATCNQLYQYLIDIHASMLIENIADFFGINDSKATKTTQALRAECKNKMDELHIQNRIRSYKALVDCADHLTEESLSKLDDCTLMDIILFIDPMHKKGINEIESSFNQINRKHLKLERILKNNNKLFNEITVLFAISTTLINHHVNELTHTIVTKLSDSQFSIEQLASIWSASATLYQNYSEMIVALTDDLSVINILKCLLLSFYLATITSKQATILNNNPSLFDCYHSLKKSILDEVESYIKNISDPYYLSLISLCKKIPNEVLNKNPKNVLINIISKHLESYQSKNLDFTILFFSNIFQHCEQIKLLFTGKNFHHDAMIHLYNNIANKIGGIELQYDSEMRNKIAKELLAIQPENQHKKSKKIHNKKKNQNTNKIKTLQSTAIKKSIAPGSPYNEKKTVVASVIKDEKEPSCNNTLESEENSVMSLEPSNIFDETAPIQYEQTKPSSTDYFSKKNNDQKDDLVKNEAHTVTVKTLSDLFQCVFIAIRGNQLQIQEQLTTLCAKFNQQSEKVRTRFHTFIPPNPATCAVMNALFNSQHSFYIVGGYPRDYLITTMKGKIILSNDIDFLVVGTSLSKLYQYLYSYLPSQWAQLTFVKGQHPHIITHFHSGHKFDISAVETENNLNIDEELHALKNYLRNADLTLNTLAWHPSGVMIDFFSATKHLQRNKLFPVYPKTMSSSLAEDPIRLLRYFKLFFKLGSPSTQGTNKILDDAIAFIPKFRKRLTSQSTNTILLKKQFYTYFIKCIFNNDIVENCINWLNYDLFQLIFSDIKLNQHRKNIIKTAEVIAELIPKTPPQAMHLLECLFTFCLIIEHIDLTQPSLSFFKELFQKFNYAYSSNVQQQYIEAFELLKHAVNKAKFSDFDQQLLVATNTMIEAINDVIELINQRIHPKKIQSIERYLSLQTNAQLNNNNCNKLVK